MGRLKTTQSAQFSLWLHKSVRKIVNLKPFSDIPLGFFSTGFVFAIAFPLLISLGACHPLNVGESAPQVSINGHSYTVEIADTNAERELGLMNRPELAANAGMLFVFDTPGYYVFYMKDTLIPLDIIWIGENKKVVYIAWHSNPMDETDLIPTAAAIWVLELNAGVVTQDAIQIGDQVTLAKPHLSNN